MSEQMEALIARVAALSPEEAEARRQAYLKEKRQRRDAVLAQLLAYWLGSAHKERNT